MRCTVRRRTERRKTRRCCDHEVVQGSSHRFEAPTPQIGKLLLVGSGTGSAEARQVPARAARERRARANVATSATLNLCTNTHVLAEPRTSPCRCWASRVALRSSGSLIRYEGPPARTAGQRGPSVGLHRLVWHGMGCLPHVVIGSADLKHRRLLQLGNAGIAHVVSRKCEGLLDDTSPYRATPE